MVVTHIALIFTKCALLPRVKIYIKCVTNILQIKWIFLKNNNKWVYLCNLCKIHVLQKSIEKLLSFLLPFPLTLSELIYNKNMFHAFFWIYTIISLFIKKNNFYMQVNKLPYDNLLCDFFMLKLFLFYSMVKDVILWDFIWKKKHRLNYILAIFIKIC